MAYFLYIAVEKRIFHFCPVIALLLVILTSCQPGASLPTLATSTTPTASVDDTTKASAAATSTAIMGLLQSTPTPIDSPQAIDTPLPASMPEIGLHQCIPTEVDSLENVWLGMKRDPISTQGAVGVYSHCPPAASIQYDAIAVDDALDKVELLCSQGATDITNLFENYALPNKLLPYYRSQPIDLRPDCRVIFTVRDVQGDQIGLTIEGARETPLDAPDDGTEPAIAVDSELIVPDDICTSLDPLVEDLGLWEYNQPRSPMPPSPESCQVIFAHGDIDNSGACHVKEFKPGESVQGLGQGTFRLLRISGSPLAIRQAEQRSQQAAARDAGGSCPSLIYGVVCQGEHQLCLAPPGVCALYFYPFGGIEKTFVFHSETGVWVRDFNGTLACWSALPRLADVGVNHPFAPFDEVEGAGVFFHEEIVAVNPDTLP